MSMLHADRRHSGARKCDGPVCGPEPGPLGGSSVDREQRSGLGEPVDLDGLPTEICLHPFEGARRRRRAGDDDPDAPGSGHGFPRLDAGLRRVEDRGDDRRRAAHERHALGLDAIEDRVAVDLALHHVCPAHAGDGVRHSPAVAVEHRQGVQQAVAVVDRRVPSERRRR